MFRHFDLIIIENGYPVHTIEFATEESFLVDAKFVEAAREVVDEWQALNGDSDSIMDWELEGGHLTDCLEDSFFHYENGFFH